LHTTGYQAILSALFYITIICVLTYKEVFFEYFIIEDNWEIYIILTISFSNSNMHIDSFEADLRIGKLFLKATIVDPAKVKLLKQNA
jgi:hypothetical protein